MKKAATRHGAWLALGALASAWVLSASADETSRVAAASEVQPASSTTQPANPHAGGAEGQATEWKFFDQYCSECHNSTDWAGGVHGFMGFLPFELFSIQTLTLLFTLVMTAFVCVLMGCGVPTTANYIIMVAVAAPVLGLLNVEPLVAHFFVFYFGVLADVTPPVALAAYAAAGIAGANGFKAGNTAFRLSMGKALVPFIFVFSPSLLIVTQDFTLPDFLLAFTGAVLGIVALSAAITNWLLAPLWVSERFALTVAALLMIAPEPVSTAIGSTILVAVVARQLVASRSGPTPRAT